ncbi:ExbD/TolR family protein [Baaleninema sp.]|uniref:ExbD/TolR family protein n=1 Tax=Baaleninema sp. TaxID=3101197 RepID=UPI003D051FCB
MNFPDDDRDIPPQINIVSAIDVILAILTFFVISSLYLTKTEGFSVNLPSAETGESQQETQLVVTIAENNEVFLGEDSIDLSQLQAQVRQRMETENMALVAVNADMAVSHGRFIEVIDELRQIQGLQLAILTDDREEP